MPIYPTFVNSESTQLEPERGANEARLTQLISVGSTSRASESAEAGMQATVVIMSLLPSSTNQVCLSQVVDAIKDLVQDCNFDCNDSGIALQAMDNSHVALVSMLLRAEGFSPYRCDRNIALGINLLSLTKVLRAAQNEDILTLKAEDSPDAVNLMFESAETDRLSEYDIKLMDIDQEHLAIPETEYAATVEMPSMEFQRICRDLNALSESGKSHQDLQAPDRANLYRFGQLLLRPARKESSSPALVILATALLPSVNTPMSTSPIRMSPSLCPNPSP